MSGCRNSVTKSATTALSFILSVSAPLQSIRFGCPSSRFVHWFEVARARGSNLASFSSGEERVLAGWLAGLLSVFSGHFP